MTLEEWVIDEITSSGPMRFDDFMRVALFDRELGYYASAKAKIGLEGDFYTSVSVGALYGRLLAFQLVEVFNQLDAPPDFTVIEQGGNDGRFACDVLDALQREHPAVYERTRYVLVEPFESLRGAQKITLSPHVPQVRWVDTLADCDPVDGVYFSNEYVDALPVRLFVKSDVSWMERHVDANAGGLVFVDLPTNEQIDLPDAPVGYIAELRPSAGPWLRDVCRRLRRGAIIIADYGFPSETLYAAWRVEGTLSCYSNHRRDNNPLESPGTKDITAHVDFTELVRVAESEGFRMLGFADQCHFLTGVFRAMTKSSIAPDDLLTSRERQAFLTLTHPEIMGTQFKFLALSRGMRVDTPLSGFHFSKIAITEHPPFLSSPAAVNRQQDGE